MQRKGPGGEGERTHRGWCREEGREVGNGCVCLVYRLASENGVTPGTHVLKCAHSIPNLFSPTCFRPWLSHHHSHHSSSPVEAPSSAEGSVEAPSSAVGSAFDNERRKGQYPDPPPHAIPRPAPSDSRNVANSIKTQSCIARAHFHIVTHITGFPGATSAADLGGPSPCAPSSCQRAFTPAWQSPR